MSTPSQPQQWEGDMRDLIEDDSMNYKHLFKTASIFWINSNICPSLASIQELRGQWQGTLRPLSFIGAWECINGNKYSISGISSDNTTVMPSVLLNKDVPKSQRALCWTDLEKALLPKDYLSLILLNPIDFLQTLMTNMEIFSYQQGLDRANSQLILELLDALWSHDQIRLCMETWIESKALTQVADGVSDEFEAAKAQFLMYSNQITPEFVMTLSFDDELKKAHRNMLKCSVAEVQFRTSVRMLNIRTECEVQFSFSFGSAKYTLFSSTSNSSQKNPNTLWTCLNVFEHWASQALRLLLLAKSRQNSPLPLLPWWPPASSSSVVAMWLPESTTFHHHWPQQFIQVASDSLSFGLTALQQCIFSFIPCYSRHFKTWCCTFISLFNSSDSDTVFKFYLHIGNETPLMYKICPGIYYILSLFLQNTHLYGDVLGNGEWQKD